MKTSLDHLPPGHQRELERITKILFQEFESALAGKSSEKKKRGRILKVILFGSFARGNWVEDPKSGYRSDYDILVIVNDEALLDFVYWEAAEDRILYDPAIQRDTQLIIEPYDRVNDKLAKGQYFFSDIREEGIALYELDGHPLAEAKPLTEKEFLEISRDYFEEIHSFAKEQLETARFNIDRDNYKSAAFALHQATEHAYRAMLLTHTHYSPAIHNIATLRGLAEDIDQRLFEAWPRHHRRDKRRFELLRRAYVEARYSKHFEISREELEWLEDRVRALLEAVGVVCGERL